MRHHDTAFALDAFNQHRNGRRRNRGANGGKVIVRNVLETRHHRLEAFFNFVLARRGNARERAAVK